MARREGARPRRRAANSEERGQSAERTREKILRAAVAEFGAKGYSGARTAAIAKRAGVNQQLISYHFGGKQGLLDELRRRWAEAESARVPAGTTFGTSFAAYLDAVLDRPDWSRLVIWQALGDHAGDDDEAAAALQAGLRAEVDRLRQRQAEGEIAVDPDPRFVLLLWYALTFAPLALPEHVRSILGSDPTSREYRRWCHDQVLMLLDPARSRTVADTTPAGPGD
ncbi:MAG: TetR/AcrR family transcriptional regulator [Haloechinothrix sp.]